MSDEEVTQLPYGAWIRDNIDPTFSEVKSEQIYRLCFKSLPRLATREATDKDVAELNNCFDRYVDSYKVVAEAFIGQLSKAPVPKHYGEAE